MPVVKIKVPLGLTQNPPIPVENSMTVAKWNLGKKIYFDTIISSNNTVSCASCHNPKMGFTDQSMVSIGINGKLGGMSAPSVYNSAYNLAQFWDGRAPTLEAQSQGPPQNPSEMFDGKGNAWDAAVERLRAKPEYVAMFKEVLEPCPPAMVLQKPWLLMNAPFLLEIPFMIALKLQCAKELEKKKQVSSKCLQRIMKKCYPKQLLQRIPAL